MGRTSFEKVCRGIVIYLADGSISSQDDAYEKALMWTRMEFVMRNVGKTLVGVTFSVKPDASHDVDGKLTDATVSDSTATGTLDDRRSGHHDGRGRYRCGCCMFLSRLFTITVSLARCLLCRCLGGLAGREGRRPRGSSLAAVDCERAGGYSARAWHRLGAVSIGAAARRRQTYADVDGTICQYSTTPVPRRTACVTCRWCCCAASTIVEVPMCDDGPGCSRSRCRGRCC